MKIVVAWLCGAALIAAPAFALAQDEFGPTPSLFDEGAYFSFQAGGIRLHDRSYNVGPGHVTAHSKNGLALIFSGGYDYGQVWPLGHARVEVALGYRNADIDQQYLPGKTPLARPTGTTRVWSLMYNVINDFRPETAFDPYIGVGIGYARIEFSHYGAAGQDFIDDRAGKFAYLGMVGFRSQLSDHLHLDINWRYFATPDVEFTTVAGKNENTTFRSNAVLIGLTYQY
jgi:opacity protein-like surface antigen